MVTKVRTMTRYSRKVCVLPGRLLIVVAGAHLCDVSDAISLPAGDQADFGVNLIGVEAVGQNLGIVGDGEKAIGGGGVFCKG